MTITVQDFTGIYSEQPFLQGLRSSAQGIARSEAADSVAARVRVRWMDCTQIAGTDCYCDDEAVEEIKKLMDENAGTGQSGQTSRGSSQTAAGTDCKSDRAGTPEIHFFDNGNYHYMSKLWTDRITEPFSLVVFDHHPDMQPPRFGDILSCGGWVKKVLEENKYVQNVVIIGVADSLVDENTEAGEILHRECAGILDKVTFIKESEIREWQKCARTVSRLSSNLYYSIDKDALSPAFAATNWDQGSLTLNGLKSIIAELSCGRNILGVDICGERAREFTPIENGAQTAQEADELNNKLNQELVEFLRCEV